LSEKALYLRAFTRSCLDHFWIFLKLDFRPINHLINKSLYPFVCALNS
jgi:hypothetical protein